MFDFSISYFTKNLKRKRDLSDLPDLANYGYKSLILVKKYEVFNQIDNCDKLVYKYYNCNKKKNSPSIILY